jgi:hypothetical protein|uniref:Uncharacterized protein n=1 Tax=Zea mays TaxID=4577 RepID=A0A804LF18_MAIZE
MTEQEQSVNYLGGEGVLVAAERVAVGAEGVVARAQRREVALERLGLPAGAAVLEPDGDLARLQREVARDAGLAVRVQLVVRLEAALQRAHLLQRQAPLLLPEPARRPRRAPAAQARAQLVLVLVHLGLVVGLHLPRRRGLFLRERQLLLLPCNSRVRLATGGFPKMKGGDPFFLQLCGSKLTKCKKWNAGRSNTDQMSKARIRTFLFTNYYTPFGILSRTSRTQYLFLGIRGWRWASWIASSSVIRASAALQGFGNGGDPNPN